VIGRVLKGWFTGVDNQSFELGRFLWMLGVLSMIVFGGYAIFEGQTFDPVAYGTGFALILAAGGGAIAMKDRANPNNQPIKVDANIEEVKIGAN